MIIISHHTQEYITNFAKDAKKGVQEDI